MNITAIAIALLSLGVLGILFGVVLGFASKKFEVKVDPRVESVRSVLGGANCGACGFAGCDAFAEAVVEGKAKADGCPSGGPEAAKKIGEIMGVNVKLTERKVAKVLCMGTSGVAKERYEYEGYASCKIAASMAGGPKLCAYSCVGLGDCMDVCSQNAISMQDGVAHVDETLCRSCGECEKECPRHAIKLLPMSADVYVSCRNADIGKNAVAVCMKACIACKRCVKECENGAINADFGYAIIDYDKCTRCGKCAAVCPRGCIVVKE